MTTERLHRMMYVVEVIASPDYAQEVSEDFDEFLKEYGADGLHEVKFKKVGYSTNHLCTCSKCTSPIEN